MIQAAVNCHPADYHAANGRVVVQDSSSAGFDKSGLTGQTQQVRLNGLNFKVDGLQIIESCDGCGACCRQTPVPPFQPGEEIQRSVPERFMQPVVERVQAGLELELIPCVWFDQATLLCRHYEYRPAACRSFQISSFECHAARNAELFP